MKTLFRSILVSVASIFLFIPNVEAQQGVVPSKGKEFWLGFMQNYSGADELNIFISSSVNTSGTVTMPLVGWTFAFTVTANVTTTVSVPVNLAEHVTSEVIDNKSILIQTNDTVAVFAINFKSFTADGTQVFPIQSLGTEYRVHSYTGLSGYGSELLVVATKDDTQIEITPTALTLGGRPAGVPFIVNLDSGQTYQVQASLTSGDLTGTTVLGTDSSGSCRPFAVFSGVRCTNIPVGCSACDHICSQNIPIGVWGTRYLSVPFSSTSGYTYRILADRPGTVVTVNGGAPINMTAGQIVEVNNYNAAACFESNLPISVAQLMQGAGCSLTGDPALLILNAADQSINNVTFATVVSTVITNHYINIVAENASIPTLTLDGTPINPALFSSYASCSNYSWANFAITQGSHTINAGVGGFIAYAYGTGGYESYAYSTGSFSPIPPLVFDSISCVNPGNGNITLSSPAILFNPYWTTYSNPSDTLAYGLSYTFQPTTNEVYVVSGQQFISQCVDQYLFSVELTTPIFTDMTINGLVNNTIQVCAYEQVQLGANISPVSSSYSYSWSPAATLDNAQSLTPIATPVQDTWYVLTVSTLNGCATALDSVFIDVTGGDVFSYNAVGIDTLTGIIDAAPVLCPLDSTMLTTQVTQIQFEDDMDPVLSPSWGLVTNGTASAACGSAGGNALYFDGPGVREARTPAVDAVTGGVVSFMLKIGAGLAPCENADPGDDVVLEYSVNAGANWTIVNTYFESLYPTFTQVTEVIPVAAQTPATLFRWRQLANGGAGEDNWSIDNVVVATHDITGLNFTWTPAGQLNDATLAEPTAYPTYSSWYTVLIQDMVTTCTYEDSVYVSLHDYVGMTVTPDSALCSALGLQLEVVPTVPNPIIQWSPANYLTNANTATPTVQLDSTMQYIVQVTDQIGCSATDTVNLTVSFSGLTFFADTSICSGESVLLDAGFPGSSYLWSTSDTTQTITVNTTGSYSVTLTDSLGCQSGFTTNVTVDPLPIVNLGPDSSLCIGQSWTLDAGNPGANFVWNTPAVTQTITVTTDDTYWVEVTNSFGCFASDTAEITFDPLPVISLSDTIVCVSETITLDAGNPGSSYLWSNAATTQTIDVNAADGTYSVIVTTPTICIDSAQATLTFISFPVVDLGPDSALCDEESIVLDAGNPGETFTWFNNASSQTVTLFDDATAWVDVFNGYCVTRDTVEIVFNPLPVIIQDKSFVACLDFPPHYQLLDAGNPDCSFIWSTGETTQTIQATDYGFYYVTVTTPLNCVYDEVLLIEEYCPSALYVPNSFTPDGDGVNDLFFAMGHNLSTVELSIFDRWGELVYTGKDAQAFWDGDMNGTPVQDGVYVWKVKYRYIDDVEGTVGPENESVGHVTVVR